VLNTDNQAYKQSQESIKIKKPNNGHNQSIELVGNAVAKVRVR
jgi:hypothetical protein